MTLSQAQHDAILALGNTDSEFEFVTKDVLDELLSMDLVHWRAPEELDLTTAGERVYQELAANVR